MIIESKVLLLHAVKKMVKEPCCIATRKVFQGFQQSLMQAKQLHYQVIIEKNELIKTS